MGALRLIARAKINLYLQVGPILPSGYHEITTILQSITLADEISIEPAADLILDCDDKTLRSPNNLVLQAAEALRRRFEFQEGARIYLRKRIPVGAGLGGGSADAAAALIGLSELWGLNPEPGQLRDIAAGLGADICFCLNGGTAMATGFGEQIKPLPHVDLGSFLIAKPAASLATGDVYRAHDANPVKRAVTPQAMGEAIFAQDRAGVIEHLANDLEPAAVSLLPALAGLKKAAMRAGAQGAMVSGSGSAMMIFPPDDLLPERLAESLADQRADIIVVQSAPEGIEIDHEH
jgi:4-diphosphocytidyl-2-C-methyl-D-erythritol kinase